MAYSGNKTPYPEPRTRHLGDKTPHSGDKTSHSEARTTQSGDKISYSGDKTARWEGGIQRRYNNGGKQGLVPRHTG
jgi:hypothetical protein